MLTPNISSSNSPVSLVSAGAQERVRRASPERHQEFENILSHVIPRFRSMATRLLGNREDAEDAVQDAMLSAFKHIADFDGRAKMSTWLTAIVINAVRMQIRRRPRVRIVSLDYSVKESQPPVSQMIVDPAPTADQTLEYFELCQIAVRLSQSLPPSQSRALKSHRENEFSIRKAATNLGVPEGTLKAQLARGQARLAERFHKVISKHQPKNQARRNTKARMPAYRRDRAQLAQLPAVVQGQRAEALAGA